MLNSLFSKPYSRLYIVGDNADWAIDEEAKALFSITSQLGLKPTRIKRAWFNTPQFVHYSSQFALLNPNIYKSRHRISVDYFHGRPEDGESYRQCFEALKNRPEISKIRVSSSLMEKSLIKAGIAAQKITRIPIGVDLNLFKPVFPTARKSSREKLGIPQNAVVIGSFQKDGVGWGEGNEPKLIKGPDIFVQAVEKLRSEIPELFILLSGPSRGYVKQALIRLGVPFKHEYPKNYSSISELYDALDLYLVTSREEGGPKATLEAMAKGIPLVTTAVGQAVDLVKNAENAMMAPIEAVDELARLSLQVLSDEELRRRIIDAGRKTAEANSLDQQLTIWKQYFEKSAGS